MRIPAVWKTNLVSLLFGFTMFALFAFLPQFLQTPEFTGYGFGLSVTLSGLVMLPQSAALFAAGLLSGRLAARHGSKRVLVVGSALTAVALLGLTFAHEQLWHVLVAVALSGFGIGLAFAAMANLVVASVPASQTGAASGMNANIRTVGGALGGAVLASVVTAGARADGLPVESGYTSGFAVLGACALLATLVAALIPVARRNRSSAEVSCAPSRPPWAPPRSPATPADLDARGTAVQPLQRDPQPPGDPHSGHANSAARLRGGSRAAERCGAGAGISSATLQRRPAARRPDRRTAARRTARRSCRSPAAGPAAARPARPRCGEAASSA